MFKYLLSVLVMACFGVFSAANAQEEDISAHVHWTLEISNSDGTFDRKMDFENSLVAVGRISLTSLFDIQSEYDNRIHWKISVDNSESNPCVNHIGLGSECVSTNDTDNVETTDSFNSLLVSYNNDFSPNLTIEGQITATSSEADFIEEITVHLGFDYSGIEGLDYSEQAGVNYSTYTQTILMPKTPIQTGQHLYITVVIHNIKDCLL